MGRTRYWSELAQARKYGMPVKRVESARHNPKGRLGKQATHELIVLAAQR